MRLTPVRRSAAVLALTGLFAGGAGLLAGAALAAPFAVTFVTNPVNASNVTQVKVAGTTTTGDTITIQASDGTTSAPVAPEPVAVNPSTGVWDNSLVPAQLLDLSGLNDGTITVTVTSTLNGVIHQSISKDTVAPSQPIDVSATPTTVNIASGSSVSVTTHVNPDAASVRLAIGDGTTTISKFPIVSGGAATSVFDVSTLKQGSLTVTAAARDAAQNEATRTTTITKDTIAPSTPTVTITGGATNPTRVTAAAPGTGNSLTVAGGTGSGGEASTYHLTVTDSLGATLGFDSPATPSTTYSFPVDPYQLADGTLTFSVVATDAAGNPSTAGTQSIAKDTSVPRVTGLTVTPTPVNAAKQTTAIISGKAVSSVGSSQPSEAGTTVALTFTGTKINPLLSSPANATATIAGDGTFSVTEDLSNLADGANAVTVNATPTDPAGNVGTVTTSQVDKDTVAPVKPTLGSLGNALPGNLTAVPFSGTAEAGSAITLTVHDSSSGVVTATATTDIHGSFSGTFDADTLADGTLTGTVVATDGAGNPSVASDAKFSNKDTTAFALVSSSPTDGSTVGPKQTVSATFNEPLKVVGSSVSLVDANNAPVPGNTAVSGATITFTPTSDLATGTYSATVTGLESGAGNDPAISFVVGFTVDGSTPGAPVLTSIPQYVNAATQTSVQVSGTAAAGTSVVVTIGDSTTNQLGQPTPQTRSSAAVIVPGNGHFDAFVNVTGLKDGALNATAKATNTSNGNTSGASAPLTSTLDTVAPTVSGAAATDTTAATPSTTVTATASESGDTVAVTLTDHTNATASASGTSGSGGAISVSKDASGLVDGTISVSVVVTDPAGNHSAPATASFNKDATGPTVTGLAGTTVNAGSNNQTSVTGSTGEPGTVTVTITDGTHTVTVTPAVGADGSFSASGVDVSSLSDGTLTLSAVGKDTKGNPGPTATTTIQKDTVKPVVSALAATATTGASPVTTVSGTVSDPGIAVVVTVTDGHKSATKQLVSDGSNNFSTTFDLTGYTSGSLPVTAVATDQAGNVSDTAQTTASRDATGPTITALAATNTSVAHPSTSVTGSIDDPTASVALVATDSASTTVSGTAVVAGDGSFTGSLDLSTLLDGTITVSATGTDPVGNDGAPATTTVTKDATAPVVGTLAATASTGASPNSAVTGTVDDPTATVLLVATDAGSDSVSHTATVSPSGAFSGSLDLSSLADGTITVVAHATDAAGNNGTRSTTTTRDSAFVPGAPGTPTGLRGDRQATVSFAAPASGGAPITGYTVTAVPTSGSPSSKPASGSPFVFTGLTNGTSYRFTVHATNRVGNGPESPQSNAVVPIGTSAAALKALPTLVRYGSTITLAGTVTRTDTSVLPGTVTLKVRRDTGVTSTVATVAVTTSGTFSKSIPVALNGTYTVVYNGDSHNLASAVSAGRRTLVSPKVTVSRTYSTSHLVRLKISGAVYPRKAGTTITLYRITSSGASVLARTKIASTGGYVFSVLLPKGSYTLQVTVPKTVGNPAGFTRFAVLRT